MTKFGHHYNGELAVESLRNIGGFMSRSLQDMAEVAFSTPGFATCTASPAGHIHHFGHGGYDAEQAWAFHHIIPEGFCYICMEEPKLDLLAGLHGWDIEVTRVIENEKPAPALPEVPKEADTSRATFKSEDLWASLRVRVRMVKAATESLQVAKAALVADIEERYDVTCGRVKRWAASSAVAGTQWRVHLKDGSEPYDECDDDGTLPKNIADVFGELRELDLVCE